MMKPFDLPRHVLCIFLELEQSDISTYVTVFIVNVSLINEEAGYEREGKLAQFSRFSRAWQRLKL